MRQWIIGPNDAGQRLDKFLSKAVKRLPRSQLYKYIRIKRIKINHKRCTNDQFLQEGDVLELYLNDEYFDDSVKQEFQFAPPHISVVYEDDNLLLVNKPAGLVVHADDEGTTDTLIFRIQHYLFQKGEYQPEKEHSFVPALCNRIDRNTCGIVIAAKNADSLRILNEKIKQRELEKSYLCLVHGTPKQPEALLSAYLKKDSSKNKVEVWDQFFPGSKEIKTKYRVIESRDNLSLLEVTLLTGRTHQIRAHLAHIGHPLLGDGKYAVNAADRKRGYKHQALCSYRLAFRFTTPAGCLEYLNGQRFEVNDIWFRDHFYDGTLSI